MRLIKRVLIFILALIFYIGGSGYELPTAGASFMQVETSVSVVASQEAASVYSYDKEVMAVLAKSEYTRFSIKTTNGETLLDSLRATLKTEEQVNGDTIEYYYSPLLEKYVMIGGERVNLQVAASDGIWTIGYPMIDIGF